MRPTQIAWAAALHEGEGSIGCYDGRLILQISMVNPQPLRRFGRMFGLKVYGPYDRGENQPVYGIKAGGEKARRIYRQLRPWLSRIRRTQGDRACRTFLFY